MTLRKRTLRTLFGWVLLGASAVAQAQTGSRDAEPPVKTILFPLSEVRPGLSGVAYTVFSGVRPEVMGVEILGTLTNALGPKRDLILARLHGGKPEYTGVVAGMSGSPVYIDGRLVGALSYRIGQFSKEPIAGITPIEQMLEVDEPSHQPSTVASASAERGEMQPMEAPLAFNGFSPETVARFGDTFRSLGFSPISGLGGVDQGRSQPEPLRPGSAVSAVLVKGDLSVIGTCTVSYIEAGRLLACGHPLTQAGEIELPMAKAEVLATLASPLNSFKIVNATEIVGAFTEDRSSAIAGRLGAQAQMIPVDVTLTPEGYGPARTMHFDVANHRELTPQLMTVAVYQCLQQVLTGTADSSYGLSGEIRLAARGSQAQRTALPVVKLDGWQSQSGFGSGAITTALAVGDRFTQLFANPQEQPQMLGVDLHVSVSGRRKTATLETARLSVTEAQAGQTIEVNTTLQPYQAGPFRVATSVRLPDTLEPGTLRLLVSDGATLDRLREPTMTHSLSLSDTVTRLNSTHPNDRVYVTLLTHEAEAFLDAAPLAGVPLSLANVLEPLKSMQRLRLTGESMVELGSSAASEAVSGSQILTVIVR